MWSKNRQEEKLSPMVPAQVGNQMMSHKVKVEENIKHKS